MAEAPFPRTITVSGEAEEDVAPDVAVLSGQLVSKAKELASAKENNDKMVERVLMVTKEFDIPKEKVAASNVYISPEYRYDNGKQHMIGYMVSRTLSITMEKMDIHEKVLSALVEKGIDQINGVNFTIANPEARADALRIKAIQNARKRAESMAQAAGAKLGKVITIGMNGAPSPMPVMFRSMAAEAKADSVAPSLPGLNHVQEHVSVTFELE